MRLLFLILVATLCIPSFGQQCTKLGTFIGSFQPSFLQYIEAENPQVERTIINDRQLSLMANNPSSLSYFLQFLDTLKSKNVETVMSIRFVYSDSLQDEDRIITDQYILDSVMTDIGLVISAAGSRLDYVQILNETFGVGKYNTTLDSLTSLYGTASAEQTILNWIDTICFRMRNLIDSGIPSMKLLSPSVQVKGLESLMQGQSNVWTSKLTLRIYEVASLYCDILNFHWYPESFQQMQVLMEFSDTSQALQMASNMEFSCTEWSQAHEIRNVLQGYTAVWIPALQVHCGTSDSLLTNSYLALVNDSLGINHSHIFDMYQLMNQHNYLFASYFAMTQDFYSCGNVSNIWYALAALYATKFTFQKIPNGKFHDEYTNIRQFISAQCDTLLSGSNNLSKQPEIYVFPNPTQGTLLIISNAPIDKIYIYNSIGDLVHYISNPQTNEILMPKGCDPGLYFVNCQSEKKYDVFKIMLIK